MQQTKTEEKNLLAPHMLVAKSNTINFLLKPTKIVFFLIEAVMFVTHVELCTPSTLISVPLYAVVQEK